MSKEAMAAAFNEWMRRYTEDPKGFDADFQTAGRFLAEANEGKTPSYGETSAAYMLMLQNEMAG